MLKKISFLIGLVTFFGFCALGRNSLHEEPMASVTTLNDFIALNREALIQKMDRPLTFKERISHLALKRVLKRAVKNNPEFGTMSVTDFFQGCSKIILKNGDLIEADITQITPTEIKYKRCGKSGDPEFIVNKSEVLSVKNADGETLYKADLTQPVQSGASAVYNNGAQVPNNYNANNNNYYQKQEVTDPMAIWALVGSLLIPILGIIFGIISLSRISKNPQKYKGRGMAITALVISVVWILLVAAATSAA